MITRNESLTCHSIGYVQGMSDLLSPLYMVIQDDLVFQAFVGFMNRTVCVLLCEIESCN